MRSCARATAVAGGHAPTRPRAGGSAPPAARAPTGGNRQGWRWVVVTDAAKRARLADLYREGAGGYFDAPAAPDLSTPAGRVRSSAVYLAERLQDAPQSTPSLEELATLADVHPAHLARTFKRLQGVSVGEYHRNLRVAAACQALRDPTRPIAEVAAEAGFSDQSHFTRMFRRLTGQTPGEFRDDAQRPS